MALNDTWKHTPEVPQINGKGAEALQQEFLGMRLPNDATPSKMSILL